jgi:hypothetical protein
MVLSGNSLVPDRDVVRLFYVGSNALHGGSTADGSPQQSSIGMATWPKDRFVGLRAGSAGGDVKVALNVAGAELHVNANAVGGSLVAGVTENGEPVLGLEASDCVPLSDDSSDHVIRWQGGASLASLIGRSVDISVKLSGAEIFSINSG